MVVSSHFTRELFEAQVELFEEAWLDEARVGPPPQILTHLPPARLPTEPGYGRKDLLFELIMIDLECRWRESSPEKIGLVVGGGPVPDRPLLEDYVRAFPELGSVDQLPAELIAQEYQTRKLWGDQPSHDEYRRRFQHLRDELAVLLSRLDTSTTESGSPFRCPNCDTRVDISDDSHFAAATCESCGISFSPLKKLFGDADEFEPKPFAQFDRLKKIGGGAFGTVWRAWDSNLERWVALKFPRSLLDKDDSERLHREAKAAARLDHPNIVKVYAFKNHQAEGEDEIVYIVCDYIEGESFDRWLVRHHPKPRKVAELCRTIASALHHAHQKGVIHRDIKPSNIILDVDHEPRVTDFGLARRIGGENGATGQGIIGAPAYMSPEQASGKGHAADCRSDIFSLGVVFYEMLTGERPFREGNVQKVLDQVIHDDPPPPRTRDPRIPKDLETICLKCLKKEPAGRYASADELAEDLGRYLRGEPIKARPVTALERAIKWTRRRPAAAMLVAVSILATVAIGISGWLAVALEKRHAEHQQIQQQRRKEIRAGYVGAISRAEDLLSDGQISAASSLMEPMVRELASRQGLQDLLFRAKHLWQDIREEQAREQQWEDARTLRHHYEEAMIYYLQPQDLDADESLDHAIAQAKRVLQMAGVSQEGQRRSKNFLLLPPTEQDQIETFCYQLLLVLAEATHRRNGSDRREAVNYLQQAAQLDETAAYHLLQRRIGSAPSATSRPPKLDAAFDYVLRGRLAMLDPDLTGSDPPAMSFRKALEVDRDNFWARYYLAMCLLRDDKPEEAQRHLAECERMARPFPASQNKARGSPYGPALVWTQIMAGFASGMSRDFVRARQYFDEAEANWVRRAQEQGQDRDHFPLQDARYILLVHRGITHYWQASSLDDGGQERAKYLEAARSEMEKAVSLRPDEFPPRANLAIIYRALGRFEDAEQQYSEGVRRNPDQAAPYRARAEYYRHRAELAATDGDGENAHRDLLRHAARNIAQAIRLEQNPSAKVGDYIQLGHVLSRLKDYQRARAAFDSVLDRQPRHPQARLGRARSLLHSREDYVLAVADFDAYLQQQQESDRAFDVYRDRGFAHYKLFELRRGDHYHHLSRAIEDYTHALRLLATSDKSGAGTDEEIDLRLLRAYAQMNSAPELAFRDFDQAIAHDPTNARAYGGRGWACYWMERYAEAIADFSQAISGHAENDSTRADFYYGRAMARLGMREALPSQTPGPEEPSWAESPESGYDAAIEDFTQAILRNPADLDFYYGRAWARVLKWDRWVHVSSAAYPAALADYRSAIQDARHIVRASQHNEDSRCRVLLNAAAVYAQNPPRWSNRFNDAELQQLARTNRREAERLVKEAIRLWQPDPRAREKFWDDRVSKDPRLAVLWKRHPAPKELFLGTGDHRTEPAPLSGVAAP